MGWFPDLYSNNTEYRLTPAAGAILGEPHQPGMTQPEWEKALSQWHWGMTHRGVSAGLKAAKEFAFSSTGWCNSGETLPFPSLMKSKSSQVWSTWILKPFLDRASWNAGLAHSSYCSCGFGCSTKCFLSYFRSSISDEGKIPAVSAWEGCQTATSSCCSEEILILLPAPLPGHCLLHTLDLLATSTHPEDSLSWLKKAAFCFWWKPVHQIHARNSIKLHKGVDIPLPEFCAFKWSLAD